MFTKAVPEHKHHESLSGKNALSLIEGRKTRITSKATEIT